MSEFEFDEVIIPDQVDTRGSDFDVIKPGKQPAQLIEYEIKLTQTGKMLILTWEIIEGPHEKRRIWDNCNYKNANAETERLARIHLAKIGLALGIAQFKSPEQALFKPLIIDVRIEKDKSGNYPDRNGVRNGGFSAYGSIARTAAERPAQTARSSPPASQDRGSSASGEKKKPWER